MPYGSGINRNNNDDDRVRTGVKYIYTFQDTNTVRMATGIIFSFSRRTDKVSIPLVKTPGPTTALSIFAPLRAHHQGGMTTDWSHPPRTVRRLTPENGSGGRPAIRVAAVAPEEGL